MTTVPANDLVTLPEHLGVLQVALVGMSQGGYGSLRLRRGRPNQSRWTKSI